MDQQQATIEPDKRSKGEKTALIVVAITAIVVMIAVPVAFHFLSNKEPPFHSMTPAATYSRTPVTGGWQVNIMQITVADVPWDDVIVELNDGDNFAYWDIETSDLDGGAASTSLYGTKTVGTSSVTLSVTDMSGNGMVNSVDHFTLTATPAFSPATNYTAVLVFEPTSMRIGVGIQFTG